MERDIDRGDDTNDNKEHSNGISLIGEHLLHQQYQKARKDTPASVQQPFGGYVRHGENDTVVRTGGLLRRPSTPNRQRGSTPTQIPQPINTARNQPPRLVGWFY